MSIITDDYNEVVFPASIDNPKRFSVPGLDARRSFSLVFTNYAYPNFFIKGQELRIWYTEDLNDHTTSDNDGKHCVKVYAKFERIILE